MLYFDWTYLVLVLPAVIFSLWASAHVKSTYRKYDSVLTRFTGGEAAERLLHGKGLYGVSIGQIAGELSDRYDPKTNRVSLSNGVYGSRSAAAVGVACHECGHAMQYAENYFPVKLRTAIVPLTNFGAKLATPLLLIGLLLSYISSFFVYVAYAGVACFALCTFFQLVTLPVEFNASRRAMEAIRDSGCFSAEEQAASKKVLTAAALTYVAALSVSMMQLLRLLIILGGNNRRK